MRCAVALLFISMITTHMAATAQTRPEIVVGLALSETGRYAAVSRRLRTSAEQAVANLNSAGGVLGERLRLFVSDDSCTEAGAIATAENFWKVGAHLVIGHPCERSALAAAAVYARKGLLFLATETRHPALTERYPASTILRLAGRDDHQGAAAGDWLANVSITGRTAIIQDPSGYARTAVKGVTEVLAEHGRPPPQIFPIHTGQITYESLVTRIKNADIDAIFFAGYPAEAAIILKAMQRAKLETEFLGSDSLLTSEFAARPIARRANVRVLARPVSREAADLSAGFSINGPARSLVKNMASNIQDDSIAAAVRLWANATRAAGTYEPTAIRDTLLSRTFSVRPYGNLSFDVKGDARIPSFIPAISDGTAWKPENTSEPESLAPLRLRQTFR